MPVRVVDGVPTAFSLSEFVEGERGGASGNEGGIPSATRPQISKRSYLHAERTDVRPALLAVCQINDIPKMTAKAGIPGRGKEINSRHALTARLDSRLPGNDIVG